MFSSSDGNIEPTTLFVALIFNDNVTRVAANNVTDFSFNIVYVYFIMTCDLPRTEAFSDSRVNNRLNSIRLLLRSFPYLGSWHQVFNLLVLRSCASSIFTCFSFMSFLITSLHLGFGLPIFRCPPTSIFDVLITKSSSGFLATWPNHLSLASLIF